MTKNEQLMALGDAIREAMDNAAESGLLDRDEIYQEVRYQLENYEWDL